MKKKMLSLLSAILLFSTVACSGSSGSTIDKPVENASEKGSVTAASGSKPAETAAGTPVSETSSKETQANASVSVEEQVLVDKKDVKITLIGMSDDSLFGPGLKLRIENNSDKDLTIQSRSTSVNGYMIDSSISSDVAAGKKSNDEVTFMSSDLEAVGINDIADVELSFVAFTTDEFDTYFETDPIQVKTSLADSYEYTYDDSGKLLYEKNKIRILAKGISTEDSIFGPGLILFIENLSKKSVTVQGNDVSVNGYMIDSILSSEVSPGKRILDALTFFQKDLEDNEIEEITDVELSFRIFETESFDTIDESKKYVLEFQ